MSLRIIWTTIARWRWIMIPFLVVALGAGTLIFLATPRLNTVDSSYLFLSPVKDLLGVSGNPLLQPGSGVAQTVDVLAVSLADEATVRQLTKSAPELKYTASRNLSVGAPLMDISVEYTDLATARSALATLGELLQERLSSLQSNANAPASQWITLTMLTDNQKPKLSYGNPVRNGLLVLFALLGLGFLVVAIAEQVRSRRDAARHTAASVAPGEPVLTGARESADESFG